MMNRNPSSSTRLGAHEKSYSSSSDDMASAFDARVLQIYHLHHHVRHTAAMDDTLQVRCSGHVPVPPTDRRTVVP